MTPLNEYLAWLSRPLTLWRRTSFADRPAFAPQQVQPDERQPPDAVAVDDVTDEQAAKLRRKRRKERAEAHFKSALDLYTRWRLDAALKAIDLAIAARHEARYHVHRAHILHAMGNVPNAISSARIAHELDPLNHHAIRLLASFSPESILSTRAMEKLVYAARDPAREAARASVAMFRAVRPNETLRALTRILERIEISPRQRDQIEYFAGVAAEFSSPRSALRYFNRQSPEGSQHSDSKAIGRARCLLKLGKPEAALEAVPANVAYCAVRLEANLALGRIGDAYAEYQNRKQVRGLRATFPNFRAEGPIQLILTEGGPGDEIRFASLLRESGASVATCGPRLASLMQRSFPEVDFICVERPRYEYRSTDYRARSRIVHIDAAPLADNAVVERALEMDGVSTLMDIVGRLRPDREAFPRSPYLTPDPERLAAWRRVLSTDRPNIALNWRSMLFSIHRSQHYLLAQQLEPLKAVNAHFWLFQPGMTLDEYVLLRDLLGAEIPPLLDVKDDFEGQAAFLSSMDAVVSPYSTTAELAGALGVPTFMMAFTPNTQWRRNPDGSDVWHGSGRVICGATETMGDLLVGALQDHFRS